MSNEADIVERLRHTYPRDSGYAEQANQAADLITELRAELDAAANEAAVLQEVNADLLAAAQLETVKADAAARDMRERVLSKIEELYISDPKIHPMQIRHALMKVPTSTVIATNETGAA